MLIKGDKEIIERLHHTMKMAHTTAEKALTRAALTVRSAAMKNIVSGGGPVKAERLTARSGQLRTSIIVQQEAQELRARVGIPKDVTAGRYARIHEFGGIIRARNKPYLRFFIPDESAYGTLQGRTNKKTGAISIGYAKPTMRSLIKGKRGHWVMVKQVTMPKRPYLGPALESKRAEVGRIFKKLFKDLLARK